MSARVESDLVDQLVRQHGFEDMGFGSTIEENEADKQGHCYPRSHHLSPLDLSSSPPSPMVNLVA